ncbi:hypothetical protein [Microbacterium binotii]|uniref:Uncharacterized protein n=1 Tax=Microbacterium binotii TaxID=462710 RepID=A0ABP6BHG2_9MICO
MKHLKTLVAGVTAATIALLSGVVLAPSVALAAEGTSPLFQSTPTGTQADWSWTTPDQSRLGAELGPDEFGRSLGTLDRVIPLTQEAVLGQTVEYRPDASLLGVYHSGQYGPGGGGDVFGYPVAGSGRTSWGTGSTQATGGAVFKTRLLAPQPTVNIDLAAAFPEFGFSAFYVPGANGQTGWASSTDRDCGLIAAFPVDTNGSTVGTEPVNCAAMSASEFGADHNQANFRAQGTATGVTLDLSVGPYARGGRYNVTAVGLAADNTQVPVSVTLAVAAYGGAPSAGSLTYATPVGTPIVIPDSDLQAAVEWRTGMERAIAVEGLPASITPVQGGYRFVSEVPVTESFGFRGTERQDPAGLVDSPLGTVTVTATPVDVPVDPDPVVTAPTVDDFAFTDPLPGGVAAEVDLLSLTHGADFDPREWVAEAADVLPWEVRGGTLLLTPEQDGVALETRWRWRSLINPTVTSRWATVTAPAAAVIPDPEPEPQPEVTPTPEATPTPTAPPATTPTPPPGGAKTGDEGLTLLGYGAALLLGAVVSFTTRSRRFARR